MKYRVFYVLSSITLSVLAVALGATLAVPVRKMFILPEGVIVVSLAIWFVLYRLTRIPLPERQAALKVLHEVREAITSDAGQDIAEYAVMLAVILVIVVGTIKMIGGASNNVFSEVASSLSQ